MIKRNSTYLVGTLISTVEGTMVFSNLLENFVSQREVLEHCGHTYFNDKWHKKGWVISWGSMLEDFGWDIWWKDLWLFFRTKTSEDPKWLSNYLCVNVGRIYLDHTFIFYKEGLMTSPCLPRIPEYDWGKWFNWLS